MSNNVAPERTLLQIARDGIAAISADAATAPAGESILDEQLQTLDADERAKARALWVSNPPKAIMGYARKDSPFPLWAVVMTSEEIQQDYIGVGEEALLDDEDLTEGFRSKRRVRGVFTWYTYAEHPDWCAYNYRVLRRIMNAGIPRMLRANLQDPTLSGADLIPDPQYTPENLFVRRLTITLEYEEDWTDRDALWQALNGEPSAVINQADQISVHHVDQVQIPGKVKPIIL